MTHPSDKYDFFAKSMKGFDNEAFMASQRKNFEALMEANKVAMEVMRSMSQMQQQYLQQTFENFSHMMKDLMTHGITEEGLKKQAANFKEHLSHSMEHGAGLASLMERSNHKAAGAMKGTLGERMSHMKDFFEEGMAQMKENMDRMKGSFEEKKGEAKEKFHQMKKDMSGKQKH